MLTGYRQHSPTGRPHLVKLYDKDISVTLAYSSPPRNHNKTMNINESLLNDGKDATKVNDQYQNKIINPFDKKFISKFFYRGAMNHSNTLVEQFQNYHRDLLLCRNQTQRRIKVYSKQKLSDQNKLRPKYSGVPTRTINIQKNMQKNQRSKPISTKIKLYSPSAKKRQPLKDSNIINIKLYTNKKQQQKNSLGTPSRKKSCKLEVTSSKSRGKNSSLMTYKQQLSSQPVQYDYHKSRQSPAIEPLKTFNSHEVSYD